jgi:predicted ATPase
LFYLGEPISAHIHHTQTLAVYTLQEYRFLADDYGLDLSVTAHSWLSWELWQLGYPDQALQHSQAARILAEEMLHPYSLAQVVAWAAVLHQYRREVLAAHEQATTAVALATEQGLAQRLARGKVIQGWALAMQGQSEAGIAQIGQGLAASLATGAKMLQLYALGLLAEAYGKGGRPDEGLPLLDEAVAVIDATKARFYEAEIYRLKGTLLLQLAVPDVSCAEACFHQALDIARQQEAKTWELCAATSLARLWQQQNKGVEAYELLAPVYEWFTEGFDTADLIDARDLFDALKKGR